MSKKNKNKNNNYGGNNTPFPSQNKPSVTPVQAAFTSLLRARVTEVTEEEIKATPELKEEVDKAIEKANKYSEDKVAEADKYFDAKKAEADRLVSDAQSEVDEQVSNALEKTKSERDAIIKEANEKAESAMADIKSESSKLDKRREELVKDEAKLESDRLNYKDEVLKSITEESKEKSNQLSKLDEQVKSLQKDLQNKKNELESIKQNCVAYLETIKSLRTAKAECAKLKLDVDQLNETNKQIEAFVSEKTQEINRLKGQILQYGDDPASAIRDCERLKKENKELSDRLANQPTEEELENLRNTQQNFEIVTAQLDEFKKKNRDLESENIQIKVDKDEIESYRKFIKILELQKSELQRELDRNITLYNNKKTKIFANLSKIDEMDPKEHGRMPLRFDLSKLCTRFRAYMQNREDKTKLYYSDRQIRTFIAGFASSRITILEGLSGTGKSSLPQAFHDFIGAETVRIPVQSSWKDRNDLLGFYNDFKKQYKETEFLKAIYKASHDPNTINCIVLDEMNLSRIEYYFADLLSVLEDPVVDNWAIDLVSDSESISTDPESWPKLIHDGKLKLLENTWFIGTANKDDSTFTITDKVYDRSVILNFEDKGKPDPNLENEESSPINITSDAFNKLLSKAKVMSKDDKDLLEKMVGNLDKTIKELFNITFGNRIENQLEVFVPVYMACGGTMEEAVDVMFARKVMRKLDGLFDEKTKENLEFLKENIKDSKFDLTITMAVIQKMIDRI